MTLAQTLLMVVWFIVCCVALAWFIYDARVVLSKSPSLNCTDRAQVLEMLTKVSDQSSLSVYKRAYKITNEEIIEKRRSLALKFDD